MTGRQGARGRAAGRIQDIIKVRQTAGMDVLILMRILVWIGVLDHSASGLRFQDDPGAIALFQIVGDLHAGTGSGSRFRPEFDIGVRLIPVDGNAADIHIHGADVQSADGGEVLKDTGAYGLLVALLFFAATGGGESSECQNCKGKFSHQRVAILNLESIAHEKVEQLLHSAVDGKRELLITPDADTAHLTVCNRTSSPRL